MSGCLQVAESRARIDESVGQANTSTASIEVVDGLAAVRAFSSGQVHLWAGAPAIQFSLDPGSQTSSTWTLRVENLMPEARIIATSNGQPMGATIVATPHPTETVWSLEVLPGTTTVAVRIAPDDALATTPFRFAALADVQDAINDVQDIYAQMNADPAIRFMVMSGDLTERGSESQLARFAAELKDLNVPCYATLGNHELGIEDGLFHQFFGRGNTQFFFHNTAFTLLDAASATLAPQVYDWLEAWLVRGANAFHAVFMHIPPLDPAGVRNGGFASRAEANMLLGRLARAGVDLTIYGHVHSYYAYSNAGIPAFISGGGGAIPQKFDRIGRHFLTIDVDPISQRFQTAVVRVD